MPKTLKQIWNNLDVGTQRALMYGDDYYALDSNVINSIFYTDDEVDKIVSQCLNAKLDVEDFALTGVVRCPVCKNKFIKITDYIWKPDCKCFKKEDIQLSVG